MQSINPVSQALNASLLRNRRYRHRQQQCRRMPACLKKVLDNPESRSDQGCFGEFRTSKNTKEKTPNFYKTNLSLAPNFRTPTNFFKENVLEIGCGYPPEFREGCYGMLRTPKFRICFLAPNFFNFETSLLCSHV